jgi:hypothetical protein
MFVHGRDYLQIEAAKASEPADRVLTCAERKHQIPPEARDDDRALRSISSAIGDKHRY